ncbi:MAG: hypothetical protein ABR82_05805 [Verrucomicrobia subdivision 6 bacterium BACL9 MAG-120507-bin52]|jgi:hypothetical protein|uniref:Uncharacterized protein n=1 Tax=Verrucomicrobia subdivision 6 bacterium BACL9 MAG-120507-bin52 TaxID=1655590 RepID=A0A0R2RKS9_9BACT|nr:MAG: hypothetical protein ABR82_05805 [Verrucomicrobia subdivision 6 bacterium BACL9 MAG-120507-bin52]
MNFLLLLGFLVSGNMLSAGKSLRPDELLMAQAEAKAYRAAWLELQRRDEILGIAALSNDVRDSHDQIARLSGELIRAERFAKELAEQTKIVLDAAANWAGEPIPAKKAAARAEFESAKRALSELAKNNQPRSLARGLTDAQVVAVDRDQQALVLNLGRSQGAKEGMPFRILRGDKVLGTCRLLEVRELISAGLPEQLNDGVQIQVGDRVSVLAQK